ncbi:hypothetical protein U9M48_012862 [Paspalum notatum var. saurae]|uniref:Uncharacterized protein n=1 Tax=Paspalum notatum var. saurae TaxID=547442 RepID=A0AAQ3SZ31_PASNO
MSPRQASPFPALPYSRISRRSKNKPHSSAFNPQQEGKIELLGCLWIKVKEKKHNRNLIIQYTVCSLATRVEVRPAVKEVIATEEMRRLAMSELCLRQYHLI